MDTTTTRTELQERQITSLDLPTSIESLNDASLRNNGKPVDDSMFCSHSGSEYNLNESSASMSGRTFVLSCSGKPLTPCRNSKARKLLEGKVAKPVWNKFGTFGIQMLVDTRKETPKTVLGIDNGTKFEGYSLICNKENLLNVMWKLPDKKKLVRKLEERRELRRARRWRNCRRREARFDNRSKKGFIAPSQLMMVQSRLKAINEFFKCYPINKVAIEDVKFNHRDKRWGKNFSTIEVGKNKIKSFIMERVGREGYFPFEGFETEQIRKSQGLKKSSSKSLESFNSHCVDSYSIASAISSSRPNYNLIVVDDTYLSKKRKLHDTQPAKGNIRAKYSTGNFKGIKKGTICEYGQIVGGTKDNVWIRNQANKRIGKNIKKVNWLSHNFKTKEVKVSIPPTIKMVGFLDTTI